MIKIFKYKILQVEFYPFGGITKIDKPINSSINKEMIISLSGVFFQLILSVILFFFKDSFRDYSMFQLYNLSIFLFNLIPIIPLDGSIFVHSVLEKFFPFQKAYYLYQIVSIIMFSFFLFVNFYFRLNNYFICCILITQFFMLKKQEKYIFHRFYLERYLNEYPFKHIYNHKALDVRFLKKNAKHYFYLNHKYVDEKEMIRKYFYEREIL